MGKWKKSKEVEDKEKEVDTRITKIFNSIDWHIMDDHINSRTAWKVYRGIIARAQMRFHSLTFLAGINEERNPLISYYKEMYPNLECEKPSLDKLMLQKIQAYGGMLKKKPFHIFGLGFGMGSVFIGGCMYAAKFF